MVERKPENQSSSILGGWKPVGGEPGHFTTEKAPQSFMTDDFKKFSESMQARWDLGEYLKVKLQQILHKKTPSELPPSMVTRPTIKPDTDSLRDIVNEISTNLPPLDKKLFRESQAEILKETKTKSKTE